MKIQSKNVKGLFVAGLFALSAVAGMTVTMQSSQVSAAGTYTWSGGGADLKFSTASNWEGGVVPTDGAKLIFPCLQGDSLSLINDLVGVRVASIDTPIKEGVESCQYMSVDRMDFGESVSFGGGSTRYERQAMVGIQEWTGVSHLTVDGTGVTLRDGADLASYTVGNMGCGDLSARSSASTIVKDGYGLSPDYMGNIVFNSSSRMGIYSPGRDLNLAGVYTMKSGSSIGHVSACMGGLSSMPSTVTISGEMILEGEIPYTLDSSTTVIITGKLSGSGKLVPAPDNKGTLINNSSDNSSNTSDGAVSIVKEKTTKLEGVKPDEEVIALAKETLILVGERGGIHVPQSAVLKGTGKAANVSVYGVVAPGFSPGCLTFNSLYLAGEYQVELGGTEACSGYDQIRVLGDMGSEPLRLDSDRATLSLYGFGDFVQQKDDQFTIIDNQTEHAVQGTFKGLAEGAEVKVGEAIFTISYKGGDGNDVVLTAQNSAKLPGVPNTGIAQIISANPVVVAVMGVLTAGVLMLVRRKARQ